MPDNNVSPQLGNGVLITFGSYALMVKILDWDWQAADRDIVPAGDCSTVGAEPMLASPIWKPGTLTVNCRHISTVIWSVAARNTTAEQLEMTFPDTEKWVAPKAFFKSHSQRGGKDQIIDSTFVFQVVGDGASPSVGITPTVT